MSSVNILVEELLNESLSSEIEKNVSGVSKEELDNIKSEIKGKIKTQAQKEKVLNNIEELIDNSNRIITYDGPASMLKTMIGNLLTGSVYGLVQFAVRITNSNDRQAFRRELIKLHSEVQAIKVKE